MYKRSFSVLSLLTVFAATALAQHPVSQGVPPETESDAPSPFRALLAPHGKSQPGTFRYGRFTGYQVNVDPQQHNITGDAANEPTLAVDTHDKSRIAIGWRQFDTVGSNFRQAGNAYSTDGGKTWTVNPVLDTDPNNQQFRSDPVFSYDLKGHFFYNSLPEIPQYNFNFTNEVFPSNNFGKTWQSPTYAYGGDKQWFNVDRTKGFGSGNQYETWSDFTPFNGNLTFTRSVDGGNTFEFPVQIPTSPTFGSIAVGPDGEVYVAGTQPFGNDFCIARSDTARFKAITPVTFQSSTNVFLGGAMWEGAPMNPEGLMGMAWVGVAPNHSPYRGDVYLLCTVVLVDQFGNYDQNNMHVMFSRSSDHGATWSAPVQVDSPAPLGPNQAWFGTMAVAPNGRLDVVYDSTAYDTSFGPDTSVTLYCNSWDGGKTWSKAERLTPAWDPSLGYPNQHKIGDYYHIVSQKHAADLAFSATFNGEEDVYFMRIPTNPDRDKDGRDDDDDSRP